jgi:hypothetical protein
LRLRAALEGGFFIVDKPVRLELNNSGSWKLLGRFDAADDEQSSLVLDAAEDLVKTLHNNESPKGCPTLRVSIDDTTVLMRWQIERGWYDAATGEPV